MKIGLVTVLRSLHTRKSASVAMVLLSVIMLVTLGGCMFNSRFRNTASGQCREWSKIVVREGMYGKFPGNAAREMANVKDRLEYYLCVNRYFHHRIVSEAVFDSDLASVAGVVGEKLYVTDDDVEVWNLLMILSYVKGRASRAAVEDQAICRAVLSARARTKGKPYFKLVDNYSRYICPESITD